MCYYVEVKFTKKEVKDIFNIKTSNAQFEAGSFINGFAHPYLPIIKNDTAETLTTDYSWGLVPSWAKDIDRRKNALNARIETIDSLPTFKNINQNRCLILASGFFEWRWLDKAGKKKEKFIIKSQTEAIFSFAGLYDTWLNPLNGQIINSFTMVTTQANEVMSYVHNHKQRMPIVLKRKDEVLWLDSNVPINEFAFPYESDIIAYSTL